MTFLQNCLPLLFILSFIIPTTFAVIVQLCDLFFLRNVTRHRLSSPYIETLSDVIEDTIISLVLTVFFMIPMLTIVYYIKDISAEPITSYVFLLMAAAFSIVEGGSDNKLFTARKYMYNTAEFNVATAYIDKLSEYNRLWHNLQFIAQAGLFIVLFVQGGILLALVWAAFHWLFHDILVNIALDQKWYYVGTTAFIDKQLRWVLDKLPFNDDKLIWIGIMKIIVLLLFTILYILYHQ